MLCNVVSEFLTSLSYIPYPGIALINTGDRHTLAAPQLGEISATSSAFRFVGATDENSDFRFVGATDENKEALKC